jgi:hypothetical protein
MRLTVPAALAVLAVLSGPAWGQKFKDPAELMPADALLCLELRQPGPFVKELAGLFEGSALENVPDSLAKVRKGKGPSAAMSFNPGIFGLFWCPEMVREMGRFDGMGVALTGFKDRQPHWLAVILPGDSTAPGFVLRTALVTGNARLVGQVEGVKLYQMDSGRPAEKGPRPGPKEGKTAGRGPAPKGARTPTAFALMPGALLIGSPEAVRDAVRLAKGKGETPSLAAGKSYRELSKEVGDQPGLFFYGDSERLLGLSEKELAEFGLGGALAKARAFEKLINPKALRAGAASLTLGKGTLRYRKVVLLDPREKSDLLGMLPPGPVQAELLSYAPADSVFAALLPALPAEGRQARFLRVLDGLAKVSGHEEDLPSKKVAKMEKDLGIDLDKDVLGRIANLAIAVGAPSPPAEKKEEKAEKEGAAEVPAVLVVQATTEEAAEALAEEVLPALYDYGHGKKGAKPTTRKVDGKEIHTLPGGGREALHYGRQGRVLVLGSTAGVVARSLTDGARKGGWLAAPKMAGRLKGYKDSSLLALLRPLRLVALASAPRDLGKALSQDDLLVLRVRHRRDQLAGEWVWMGLKSAVARLTDSLLTQDASRGASRPGPRPDVPPRKR